jgi:hypothetical protein
MRTTVDRRVGTCAHADARTEQPLDRVGTSAHAFNRGLNTGANVPLQT